MTLLFRFLKNSLLKKITTHFFAVSCVPPLPGTWNMRENEISVLLFYNFV